MFNDPINIARLNATESVIDASADAIKQSISRHGGQTFLIATALMYAVGPTIALADNASHVETPVTVVDAGPINLMALSTDTSGTITIQQLSAYSQLDQETFNLSLPKAPISAFENFVSVNGQLTHESRPHKTF